MIQLTTLFEHVPEHPNTIVVKNEFYPKGITQQQIYDYYILHKKDILKSIDNREIIIFFATDTNDFIVKRRDSEGFLKLNSQNYEKIISGRTISIHVSMEQKESFGIIDIDTNDFNKAKKVTAEVYDYLFQYNKDISIRFTGKSSFHIIYNFKEKRNIEAIKNYLINILESFSKKYHIGIGQRANIGLDLSPNKIRGGFIPLYSLSILGLRCINVSRQKLESFRREDAKIDISSEFFEIVNSTSDLDLVKEIISTFSTQDKKQMGPREFYDSSEYRKIKIMNNKPVAYVEARIADHRAKINIGISSEYRKKDLATQILKEALNELKKRGVYLILLTVKKDNTASNLLAKKFGFKKITNNIILKAYRFYDTDNYNYYELDTSDIIFPIHENEDVIGIQHPMSDLDRFLRVTNEKNIMWSPKIDGIRCRIVIDKRTIREKSGNFRKIANIKYLSANFNEIPNFKVFDKDIIEISHVLNRELGFKYPIRLDGEGASKSKTLSHVMSQFRRIEDIDPSILQLHLFDIAIHNMPFNRRHNSIKQAIAECKTNNVFLLPYVQFSNFSINNLRKLVNKMVKEGYEGVVLQNANANYVGGDTINAIKVKKKETIDLKVVGINLGTEGSRLERKLATFVCEYKGKRINVSGKLSDKDREEFAKNPPIGKIIEVEYQEETVNGVLRNPIYVRVRDDLSKPDKVAHPVVLESTIPSYPKAIPNSNINNMFVIQEHKAIKAGLHYDIRLGHNGVLKSWATKKLIDIINNKAKRIMIFETPDHDPTWLDFEGEIESGYGAGKVLIWDKGTFTISTWKNNHITVIFNGSKIKGKYTFLQYKQGQWLLFKSGEKGILKDKG